MLFFRTITIREGERGLVFKDGRFVSVLGPGRHRVPASRGRASVEVVSVLRSEFPDDRYQLIAAASPATAASCFRVVETGVDEVAVVMFDGLPSKTVLGPLERRVFWSVASRVEARVFKVSENNGRIAEADIGFVAQANPQALAAFTDVQAHEIGLLYRNGRLEASLEPGRHAYWAAGASLKILRFDMRPQPLEVTAQEILTKDRIQIRVTLAGFYRVTDPVVAVGAAADMAGTLYKLVQFAVREAVAARTLDELLASRDAVDGEIRAYMTSRIAGTGVAIEAVGLRDVILPGEIRDLVNKVIDAERTARANLIRRQEETAATRSLLNTARLMDENPTLLRLKELETLERLVERVGRIDLHSSNGAGLETLLDGLVRRASQPAPKAGSG